MYYFQAIRPFATLRIHVLRALDHAKLHSSQGGGGEASATEEKVPNEEG